MNLKTNPNDLLVNLFYAQMLFLCYAYHVTGEPSLWTPDTRYVLLNDKSLSMLLHQRQCLLPNMNIAAWDDFQTVL